jgi:transposase
MNMGKNFELTRRTIINQLPRAGFTHLQFICSWCQQLRRRPISELSWIQGMGSLENTEPRVRCEVCGGVPTPGTFGPWSLNNRYRGPR